VTVRSGEMSTEKQLLDDGSLLTAVKQRYQPDSVRHGLLTNKVFDHNNLFIYSLDLRTLHLQVFFFTQLSPTVPCRYCFTENVVVC
jgi:hypothetical protein